MNTEKLNLYISSLSDFDQWWYEEGGNPPLPGHDCEEHTKHMCRIAWDNGAYKAERVWEISMMAAIGEDGPGRVTKAIYKLKRERDELLAALKAVMNTEPGHSQERCQAIAMAEAALAKAGAA